jgi:hypothetical protein
MRTIELDTPLWMVLGIMVVFGCAVDLIQQLPVAAMSQIELDQPEEIANGSTLLTVLQSTAAPIGVAALSSIVRLKSEYFSNVLGAQGVKDELLRRQSSLLAMCDSFFIALLLALLAVASMCFVPRRIRRPQPEQTADIVAT